MPVFLDFCLILDYICNNWKRKISISYVNLISYVLIKSIYYIGDGIMLDFLLCDDNQNILNKLKKMLESILIKNNLSGEIAFSSTNPNEIINYIENNAFDVIILDIDLKSKISGLSLANFIREKNKNSYIIFTTAHLEYSMVAYKYKTFDFLAKPVTIERLEETILRLYDDVFSESNVFFKLNNHNFIKNDDILFIQKEGKKAIIKTSVKDFEMNSSFANILNQLPNNFVRCHKSYIVNMNKISCIQSNNTIIFKDTLDYQCYIGPKYENSFTEVVTDGTTTKPVECFSY